MSETTDKSVAQRVGNRLTTERKSMRTAFNDAVKVVIKNGNIWALAIGVLIGAAMGAVINSLANDVIMQAIAKAVGVRGVEALSVGTTKVDVNGLPLDGIKYGKFLSVLFSFVIIASALILITWVALVIWRKVKAKQIMAAEAARLAAPIVPTMDEQILAELKDLNMNLRARK